MELYVVPRSKSLLSVSLILLCCLVSELTARVVGALSDLFASTRRISFRLVMVAAVDSEEDSLLVFKSRLSNFFILSFEVIGIDGSSLDDLDPRMFLDDFVVGNDTSVVLL